MLLRHFLSTLRKIMKNISKDIYSMTGIEQDAFLTRFAALSTHSVDY
jgi:hypothetical protein